MTWYRVGLWPGAGYALESATVEAFSPEDALSEAVVSKGIGFTISSDEYEEMIDELVRIDGYSRRDAEWAVDESYTWIDPPARYLLMDNFYLNEATEEQIFCEKNGLEYEYFGNRFDPSAYIHDKNGNYLCKCISCNRVVIENDDGSCPICGGNNTLAQLNLKYADSRALLSEFIDTRGPKGSRNIRPRSEKSKRTKRRTGCRNRGRPTM